MSRIEDAICQMIQDRAAAGLAKYGVTLERDDLSLEDWLTHAIEESLDRILYLYRAREKLRETARAESESIPWANAPEATHAAKDADGISMLYNCEPHIDGDQWVGDDATAPFGRWSSYQFDDDTEIHIPGDWRASLRKRPEGV